jgi:hypothetical protein
VPDLDGLFIEVRDSGIGVEDPRKLQDVAYAREAVRPV